jgi:hypothetical protein
MVDIDIDDDNIEMFKGHVLLVLDPEGQYPFKFGLTKAQLILDNIDLIEDFVKKYGGDEE